MTEQDKSSDPYNLQRFLNAQESAYEQARAEIAAGEKRSHWMWFIFPQIRGLGSSSLAQRFAISSLREATSYLEHPVLGSRIRECTTLVNAVSQRSISDIFGYPDDLKFHSSMTLFSKAAEGSGPENRVFWKALAKYFGGRDDRATTDRLQLGAKHWRSCGTSLCNPHISSWFAANANAPPHLRNEGLRKITGRV